VFVCSSSAGEFLWGSSVTSIDVVCFMVCGHMIAFFSLFVFLVFGRSVVSCMWWL
jgi:hypothetical protein